MFVLPIMVAAHSKALVCGPLPAEVVGLNLAGSMDAYL
jgi:hypothetical protein